MTIAITSATAQWRIVFTTSSIGDIPGRLRISRKKRDQRMHWLLTQGRPIIIAWHNLFEVPARAVVPHSNYQAVERIKTQRWGILLAFCPSH